MAKSIEIDRAKRLRDEPQKGHNRWRNALESEPCLMAWFVVDALTAKERPKPWRR